MGEEKARERMLEQEFHPCTPEDAHKRGRPACLVGALHHGRCFRGVGGWQQGAPPQGVVPCTTTVVAHLRRPAHAWHSFKEETKAMLSRV